MSKALIACGLIYVAAVGALAVWAQLTEQAWYYGVAVLLTLPVGLLAVVGVYLLYSIGSALADATGTGAMFVDGNGPWWLAVPVQIGNVALFLSASAVNVFLLHRLVARLVRRQTPRRTHA